MQRYYDTVRDSFGNPAPGVSVTVYLTGTTTLATLYTDSSSSDNPTSVISNPIVTGSDGRVSFAANDGDYDLYYYGTNITPFWRYRYNLFDSTTATTVPVSSISLAMPAQFAVAGSPGTAMTVTWQNQAANTVFSGPTSGGAAAPTFRALVAADVNAVALDLTTNQTAAGNKTWSGTATFNSTVTHAAAVTNSSTLTQNGNQTFGANTYVVLDKTSKASIGTAGTFGYRNAAFQIVPGITGTVAPTSGALSGGLVALFFSATATNDQIFRVGLPFDYAEGSDVVPYITWFTTGTNAGTCRWGLEYAFAKSYSQATWAATNTIYVETAASGTALRPVTSVFAAITGTNMEPDTVLYVRIFRDGAHANDTLSDSSVLLDLGLHYQTSRFAGAKNATPPFYT